MDKFESKILYILLIGILLCSVQAIAAADVGDTDNVFDLSDDIETVEAESIDDAIDTDVSEDLAASDSEEVLEAPDSDEVLAAPGTFTQLQNAINRAGNSLVLDNDYTKGRGESVITIDKDFTLDGNGHTLNGNSIAGGILDAENGVRWIVFVPVEVDTTITLKNIHFVNSSGSAVEANNYRLNIIDCTFEDNKATARGDNQGAGVYVSDESNVNITDSKFNGNNASSGSAIYNAGTLSISNTEILDNQAEVSNLQLTKDTVAGTFHKYYVTLTGNDNLINGIYSTTRANTYLKDVTYWGADGEATITANNPGRSANEAGITVNLVIRRGSTVVMNITAQTNASGVATFSNETLIDYFHLEEGTYTAQAYHYADTYYTYDSSDSDTFTCARSNHGTNVSDVSIEGYPGQTVSKISFNVTRTGQPDPVQNGTINVTIDGQVYTADVRDGVATLTNVVLPQENGEYTVYYDNRTTKYYWASNGTLTITIKDKLDTEVTVTPANITVGEDETIEFTVTDGATGDVNITVWDADGHSVDSKIVNVGAGSITVTGIPAGTYNVTVSYGGDVYYLAANASALFTVSKKASEVTVKPTDIKVGDDETITFEVTEGATGNVNYIIKDADGETVDSGSVAIEDGSFTVKDLAAGTYNVTVSYDGDVKYNASEASETFTVSKRDVKVEVLTDVTGKQGDVVQVTIKVTDSETGDAVNGGTVEYTIDFTNKLGLATSITLSATVGEDGTATVDVELSGEPGTYAAKATYSGNEKYNEGETDDEATVTESPDDPSDDPSEDPSDDSTDDSDDSTDDSDDSTDESTDDSTEESADEPKEAASKSVAAESLATGNPIAMLLMVLMALVSTISFRRQK